MRNWSGNYTYTAAEIHRPQSLEELTELVAGAPSLHALGSRHSFTGIGDAAALVSLERMPAPIEIDRVASTVRVGAQLTYAALAEALLAEGLALHNLASLPHISVGGAVATATHGSGDANGNLATAVRALELVTSDGRLVTIDGGDPRLPGAVVSLGALGVVVALTLAVQPTYDVRQDVYEGLGWDAVLQQFDAIMSCGDSVSIFHRFGEATEQLWVKQRLAPGESGSAPAERFGAPAARGDHNPVWDGDPRNATPQGGVPGPWSERLAHFRSGFTPSAGAEIQSELFVARGDAVAALETLRGMADVIRPLLLVAEIRTVAADRLWLSPQYERDSIGLHFTWALRPDEVHVAWEAIESALAPLDARSHWGKLMTRNAAQIAAGYPRIDAFRELRDELDPRGAFVNDWLRERVLGGVTAAS
jgi:alditol oxidase